MINIKKNKKGITLIALIITIIILLILAGITISTLNGENGLFEKAKQGKMEYSISQAKEKLELAISGLRIEQESKGEELTKESLPKINNDEISIGSTDSFPVEAICDNHKFYIDENFNVKYVGEADGTIVTYTTEPDGYTNQDKIKVLIKVTNQKGIKEIEYPDGQKLTVDGNKKEVNTYFEVIQNGTYTIKITDNENKETVKDIVIEKIDKVEPKDFTPTIEDVKSNRFTIVVDVDDGDETNESTKSGICRYEYYIKEKTETTYKKYETEDKKYVIKDLYPSTEYTIYVVAYDRAGNSKKSQEITQETQEGIADIYIDSTNGNDSNGDGTSEKPYATLNKLTETGIIIKGVSYNIYLQDGQYDLPSEIIDLNCNKSIKIFGNKEKTILNLPHDGVGANSGGGGKKDYSLEFNKMIMKLNSTNRNNYWCCANSITFNNIVFDSKVQFDYGFIIINTTDSTAKFNNCISIGNAIKIRTDGKLTLTLTNCYGTFTSGYKTTQSQWDYKTNYITTSPQVDSSTYKITEDESKWKNVGTGTNPDGSKANLGVYGGEYSW